MQVSDTHKRAIEKLEEGVKNMMVDMNQTYIAIFKSEMFTTWVSSVERK